MQSAQNGRTVLLVEDDPEVRSYLEMALKCQGYAVEVAQDGEEAMKSFEERRAEISAVLLDIIMPRKDGIETLKEIRKADTALPVIMVSGVCAPLNIVEVMKLGATDFICKPVNHDDLCRVIQKALETGARPGQEVPQLKAPRAAANVFRGNSARMHEIYSTVAQVGWSEAPVMVQGETGSGKEVLARELHAQSPRAGKAFLKLNCAALPSELVESELFGYERGAFTGAFQRKPGMFEMADQGTIFLDEIGDMDFKLQAKLLQVLQDREFQRLGGRDTIRVNVRVIAATHRDLEHSIAEGTFREDLYYRLNVITMHVPPLRERPEDIVPMAQFLIRKHTPPGSPAPVISPSLKQALLMHAWPGNIRELENVMRRLVVLRDPEGIAADLRNRSARNGGPSPVPMASAPSIIPTEPILEQVTKAKYQAETEAIMAALGATRWNRKKAAALLRIDYKALLYKMKKLGIEDRLVSMPGESGMPPAMETEVPMARRAGG